MCGRPEFVLGRDLCVVVVKVHCCGSVFWGRNMCGCLECLLGRECLFERYSMLSLRLCVLAWSVCLGGMSFGAGACVFREYVVAGVYLGLECVFG